MSALTTVASMTERPNETGISAIWPGRRMSANHLVDTPTMGKVTPPAGPWNDST